jgi:TrmH family RNA methyltransferase
LTESGRVPSALGLHNPLLDAVRALKSKAGRREQDAFAIEGPTMLVEALDAGVPFRAIYATEAAYERFDPRIELPEPVYLIPERAAAKISDLESPPGILAVVERRTATLEALLAGGRPLALLAGVNDPGNAGTLLRSAEIFGLGGAIFGEAGVEPHHPKVVRASMGAIFRLPLGTAGPEELREAVARAGYTVVAAAGEGTPLDDFAFPARSVLAVGNERRGLAGWLAEGDPAVAIPQHGRGESLNAAVAGSVIMYVMMRQSERSAAAVHM